MISWKFIQETKREGDLLDVGGQSDEVNEGGENSKRTTIKAVLLLLLGTIIAAAFADPLVDAVDNFSDATSIPAFFISFIALPLATNSSEAVSAIIFASRDKRKTASLTFSEVCFSFLTLLIYVMFSAYSIELIHRYCKIFSKCVIGVLASVSKF